MRPVRADQFRAPQASIEREAQQRPVARALHRIGHRGEHCRNADAHRPRPGERIGDLAMEAQPPRLPLAHPERPALRLQLKPHQFGPCRVGLIGERVQAGNRAGIARQGRRLLAVLGLAAQECRDRLRRRRQHAHAARHGPLAKHAEVRPQRAPRVRAHGAPRRIDHRGIDGGGQFGSDRFGDDRDELGHGPVCAQVGPFGQAH